MRPTYVLMVLIAALLTLFVSCELSADQRIKFMRPFDDSKYVIEGSLKRVLKSGVVSGKYDEPRSHVQGGYGYKHQGVDYRLPCGEQILSPYSGTVEFFGSKGDYGWLAIIDHKNGLKTYLAHQSKQKVLEGQEIYQGQVIGLVGETGNARGCHIHMEIRRGNIPQDPAMFIF